MNSYKDKKSNKAIIEEALKNENKGVVRWLKHPIKLIFIILNKINLSLYKKTYPRYLKWLGIDIEDDYTSFGDPWISPSCYFDPTAYGLISIGKSTTISFDVVILVHDYSIDKQLYANDKVHGLLIDEVNIGSNVFIGARAVILPGTTIGDNCIIGAGAIVKGNFVPGSIIAGNPARVIGDSRGHYLKHLAKRDICYV